MVVALVLAARLVLAAVFTVAAVAKLTDRAGTRRAVREFGAPQAAGALALLLPLAELATAILLLPASTATVGALCALALLLLFTGAIAVVLARGRAPECHCFGQLHSAPASWRTLARNGLLLVLAAFALVGGLVADPVSAVAWIGDLSSTDQLLLVVSGVSTALLVAGALAFVSLMRSYGGVLTRLERIEGVLAETGLLDDGRRELPEIGLAPGTPAPPFWTESLAGEPISVESLAASGPPALLLFTSPHCGPCKTLLPTVAGWQRERADELTVVVVVDGTRDEAQREADELDLDNVVVDADRSLSDAYQANGTPSAVVVSADGTIGSWLASGAEWIEQLVDTLVEPAADVDVGLPVGSEVPSLELDSLEGESVSVESLRGAETLFVFWNPGCGFCRAMHDDLLAWERSANGVDPRLVVVSSGDAEETRAERFRSLVLLDPEYAAGAAFGAGGTPMAVLVDADGRVASTLAAGAEAVLALAGAGVHAR